MWKLYNIGMKQSKIIDTTETYQYALLPKFVVLKHHVMIGCDRLYVHIQRV